MDFVAAFVYLVSSILQGMDSNEKYLMFENRLRKVFRHRSKIASKKDIMCFRVYDRDLPEFPLIIESYGEFVYVSEYKSSHRLTEAEYEHWLNESLKIIALVFEVSQEKIFCRPRKRKSGRTDQYQKLNNQKNELIVNEGGLKFIVNLSDYLDTGLFLDHRVTREMVKNSSAKKRVLNLFCYTGSFTVYAAAGGASETISIDLSNTYLDWATRNMSLNGLAGQSNKFIRADVLKYLPKLENDYFDLIILDPPSFSNSKMMEDILDIQRDHVEMINTVLLKLKRGGEIYFSTNLRSFKLEKEFIHSKEIKDITARTTPFDFEGKLQRWCFLIVKT